jgi:hypothetical protein
MLSIDVSKLILELKEYKVDVQRRLENMVSGFSYELALTAIDNTPLGDSEAYIKLYKRREKAYGLLPEEGLARGGWQVSLDGSLDFQQIYGSGSGDTAGAAVKIHMMNYKLGEEVIIGNKGPYIKYLENGSSTTQAPDGIMQPTINDIMSAHKISLNRYYNE